MTVLLLIARENKLISRMTQLFASEHILLTAPGGDEALKALLTTPVDAVIIDAEGEIYKSARLAGEIKRLSPKSGLICLAGERELEIIREEELEAFDFVIRKPISSTELRKAVRKACESKRMVEELELLRERASRSYVVKEGNGRDNPRSDRLQLLTQFAKALSVGFDLSGMAELFVETIWELVHPSRIALLIYDDDDKSYRIKACRGFPPEFASTFKLPPDEGLARWLASEGAILRREDIEKEAYDPIALRIREDLDKLRALVAIPLSAHGSLMGILSLGAQAMGEPYSNADLELLFTLAGHVAVAIRNISLFHQLDYQRRFTENILQVMSSGVIVLGEDERIAACNESALKILGKEMSQVVGRDLRSLPSPLGDMLFETLVTGKRYEKEEVALPPGLRKFLEVTTYQIRDHEGKAVGSVMIFDDITAKKQLAEQERYSERLELINRIMAKIAHEIRNPLVSIKTFLELFEERYDDVEFRKSLGAIARRDVESLNLLLEKLIAFASPKEYAFEAVEIGGLIRECLESLRASGDLEMINVSLDLPEKPVVVKGDKRYLHQALCYLLEYTAKKMEIEGSLRISLSAAGDRVQLTIKGEGSKVGEDEIEKLLDIFAVIEDLSIDPGPCASQRILEEMGASVKAEARGNEIRFVVNIPIHKG